MKNIQILGQKTVVSDSDDSRNSIRPLLEEAGFKLDYEKYSRMLEVKDGSEELLKICGVKGLEDFKRLGKQTEEFPYIIAGGDIIGETSIANFSQTNKILDLGIGKCSLMYLTENENLEQNIRDIDIIYTKYPKLLKRKIIEIFGSKEFMGVIEYSDSPDTTLATMLSIQQNRKNQKGGLSKTKMSAWEIVETGRSAEELGFVLGTKPELDIDISTGVFSQKKGNENIEPQMQRFIEMIQKVLKKPKSVS